MADPKRTWTEDELARIGNAEELDIATLRSDGTLRRPVIIWGVRLGDDLYVRSVKGRTGGWFPALKPSTRAKSGRVVSKKTSPLWKRATRA